MGQRGGGRAPEPGRVARGKGRGELVIKVNHMGYSKQNYTHCCVGSFGQVAA
jgi:hypothetical protein